MIFLYVANILEQSVCHMKLLHALRWLAPAAVADLWLTTDQITADQIQEKKRSEIPSNRRCRDCGNPLAPFP
jgi:hypothetical protein